ncbi:hypothetical protein HDV64DRAFT_244230 [Trichoderma sp. TUCIM 5745]
MYRFAGLGLRCRISASHVLDVIPVHVPFCLAISCSLAVELHFINCGSAFSHCVHVGPDVNIAKSLHLSNMY